MVGGLLCIFHLLVSVRIAVAVVELCFAMSMLLFE